MTTQVPQPSGPRQGEAVGPLIRLPAVLLRVGIGRSQWLDLVKEKRAPQTVKIGRSTLWLASEVDAWVSERVRQARGGQ